jgi:hypothetical protein
LVLYGLVRRITASEFTFSSFGFVWSCQANYGLRKPKEEKVNSEAVIRLTSPYKAKRRKSKF